MSVAYQSWEVSSGPTLAYTIGGQGNFCVTEGSNYRIPLQQDNVMRGLTAGSLCGQSHEADASAEDMRCHCEASNLSKQRAPFVLASSQASRRTLSDEQFVATQKQGASNFVRSASRPASIGRLSRRCHVFSDSMWNPSHISTLDSVSEDNPSENCEPAKDRGLEPDTISSSSSVSDTLGESLCTSEDASDVATGETEAESSYRGPLDDFSSLEDSLPSKKGLSRFYTGKSQSFSCLADVVSVKDLAKPENPYNVRKRKISGCSGNLDRPRLHPFRNGATGIFKKPIHNKYTLSLAVAMSSKDVSFDAEAEEHDLQAALGDSRSVKAPFRSYSVSDLQGGEIHFSHH